jgi:hypothetical protein
MFFVLCNDAYCISSYLTSELQIPPFDGVLFLIDFLQTRNFASLFVALVEHSQPVFTEQIVSVRLQRSFG